MAKNISSSSRVSVLKIEHFRGIDLNNAPSNVDLSRSPSAPNMIRGEMGKVCKRPGYETVDKFNERINGVYYLGQTRIIHAGNKLYWDNTYYPGIADTRSQARILGKRLCITDGKELLFFNGSNIIPAKDSAYVPTLMIGRSPSGGGTLLEPLNFLGRKWREQFLGDGSSVTYKLTATGLASDAVTVTSLNANGTWTTLNENSSFTVNRSTGVVTFNAAPAATPISGQDNIIITAAKDRPDYLARINGCTAMELFGVGGTPDRLFLTGNPNYPGLDFYSNINDPTYFADTNYSNLGQDGASLVGYSVVGNYLAAHRKTPSGEGGIIIRQGVMVDNKAAFPVTNKLSGEAAIAPFSFDSLGKEPMFLTSRGVYAITAAELTGDKYSQQRSFFIAPVLQKEENLNTAFCAVYEDFYMLAVNNKIYILDGMQKTYQSSEPYSSYQCECYLWTDIPARVLYTYNNQLWFGTHDGKLCRFFPTDSNPGNYHDDGKSINAHWDTPDISGRLFYKKKTFRKISLRLLSVPITGVEVLLQNDGIWKELYNANEKSRFFEWAYIDTSKMVFSSDKTPKTLGCRIRERNMDKARLRLQNYKVNEPFGLYSIALEYSESGNYK